MSETSETDHADVVARLESCVSQAVEYRQARAHKRGLVREIQGVWNRDGVGGGGEHELRIAAVVCHAGDRGSTWHSTSSPRLHCSQRPHEK